jgi:MFS family permease
MNRLRSVLTPVVLLSALGYFVDMYDLILFNIVRIPSLKAMGLTPEEITSTGLQLLNLQMAGMFLGGMIFGVLGDKWGRTRSLYASILLYSVATLLNAFVSTVPQYGLLRFIAGIGLAGELGCGIALACETLPTRLRGYGTMLIASIGFCGAIAAFYTTEVTTWSQAYLIGGGMGLALLAARFKVMDSELFQNLSQRTEIARGKISNIFLKPKHLKRFLCCVGIGVPIWFIGGILIALSPELGRALEISEPINPGKAVLISYIGTIIGDIAAGYLSQVLQSRKVPVALFLGLFGVGTIAYLSIPRVSLEVFYFFCGLVGFSAGYVALLVTIAAEQFGTNLRASASSMVPNFVRGSLILISNGFLFLKPSYGAIQSAGIVAAACFGIAVISLFGLKESFHTDLDYLTE